MQDEIRLRCLGTATPASRLVPVAVGMVERLRSVDQYGYQQATGENWRIDIQLSGGFALATIWEDGEPIDVEQCPSYLSGMVRGGINVFRYAPTTGARTGGMVQFKPSAAYAARRRITSGWGVAPQATAGTTELSGAPSYDPNGYGLAPAPWLTEGWSQAALLKPGLYSGYMRYVVQILLGSQTPVQYDYRFGMTHGVFRATKMDKGKVVQADWLIEISSENGVLAMEMPACRGTIPPENTLGYVPTGAGFPSGAALTEAIRSGKVRQLMSPGSLNEVHSKSVFSQMFGWAFDYEGRRASVVVKTREDGHLVTHLYTVAISGSTPTTASLSKEESGSVICAGYNLLGYGRANFKVAFQPMGACWPVDLQSDPPYVATNCEAPLHVFYKRDGAQSVVRYRSSTPRADSPPDEKPRPSSDWTSYDANLNQEFVEYSVKGSWLYNQQVYIADTPSPDRTGASRTTYRAEASNGTVEYFSIESGDLNTGSKYLRLAKLMRKWEGYQGGVTTEVSTSVVIPSADREAAAYQSCETDYIGSKSSNFLTYDCLIAIAEYTLDDEAKDYRNLRGDGLPSKGIATYRENPGGFLEKTSSGIAYVPTFAIPDIGQNNYKQWVHEGSFDYFGGSYGSGQSLPDMFTFPYGIPEGENAILAPIHPFAGSTSSLNSFDRRSTKKMVTSAGEFDLLKIPGVDFFVSQTLVPTLNRAWFAIDPCVCALIQTWDGGKRFMGPDLNSYEFDSGYSDFGEYGAPEEGLEMFLNFVGDA